MCVPVQNKGVRRQILQSLGRDPASTKTSDLLGPPALGAAEHPLLWPRSYREFISLMGDISGRPSTHCWVWVPEPSGLQMQSERMGKSLGQLLSHCFSHLVLEVGGFLPFRLQIQPLIIWDIHH